MEDFKNIEKGKDDLEISSIASHDFEDAADEESKPVTDDLQIPFTDPFHDEDNEDQTYGCRSKDPNFCIYRGIIGTCAFESDDHICRKPPRSWTKHYRDIIAKENGETEKGDYTIMERH